VLAEVYPAGQDLAAAVRAGLAEHRELLREAARPAAKAMSVPPVEVKAPAKAES
jgi:hypothetical protein